MTALRLGLVAGWLAIAAVTLWALLSMGLPALPRTFFADFAHPWRAQLYADLELQLLLFAGWAWWRERSAVRGLAAAAATMLLGALFTLPYVLWATVRTRGDARALLLGRRAG